MNKTAHSVVSPCANNRETTYLLSLSTPWFISYLYITNMAKFTLFILTHFLKRMTPSEFLTRYSLAGSNLLVLPPPTVASAPQDKSARISGKLNRRKQGVKAWMSEKYSGERRVFYPRNLSDLLSLVPLEIFSSSLLIFLSLPLAGAFRQSLCGIT